MLDHRRGTDELLSRSFDVEDALYTIEEIAAVVGKEAAQRTKTRIDLDLLGCDSPIEIDDPEEFFD